MATNLDEQNPLSAAFWADAPEGSPISYKGLETRRKIAEQLMSQQQKYPKTVGEGIFSAAQSFANAMDFKRLEHLEAARQQQIDAQTREAGAALEESNRPTGAPPPPPYAPPLTTPQVPPTPSPAPPDVSEASPEAPAPAPGLPPIAPTPPILAQGDAPMSPDAIAAGATQPEVNAARTQLAQALVKRSLLAPGATGGGTPAPFAPPAPGERLVEQASAVPGPVPTGAGQIVPPRPPPPVPTGNPPIVTEIPRAPPPGGMGTVPAPENPVPRPPPDSFGRTPVPAVTALQPPAPPQPLPMQPLEIRATRNALAADDPDIKQQWAAVAASEKSKRDQIYARDVETYKSELARFNADYARNQEAAQKKPATDVAQAKNELELQQLRRASQQAIPDSEAVPIVKASYEQAKPLVGASISARNALGLLDADKNHQMFTGPDANVRLQMNRFLSTIGFNSDPRVAATQQFKSYLAPIIGALRPQIVGSGSQSEKELATLEQAAGSDITMDKPAIEKILRSVERLNLVAANQHQQKVLTFTGNDPERRREGFGYFGLPMETILPDAAVADFRQQYAKDPQRAVEEIDRAFNSPGLGLRLLRSSR
jgi:hypothetical protein